MIEEHEIDHGAADDNDQDDDQCPRTPGPD